MKKILSLLAAMCFFTLNIYADEIYTYKETIPISSGITLTKVEAFYSDHNLSYSYIKADLNDKNTGITLLKSEKGIDFSDTLPALSETEDHVVASLNADFFSNTDKNTISLGIEIKDSSLLQSPINPGTMATVAKINDEILMTYLDFHIMVVAPNWEYQEVRHLNKHTSYYGDILMFTKDFNGGYSPAPGGEVVEVVVEDGTISEFRRNEPSVKIPENGCVLAVSEGSTMFLANNFKVGDKIKFDYYITPDISSSEIAFGGGAILVSEGKALKTFSHNVSGYNPRSAIGISEDGKTLYLLAVNGRQEMSRGMSMTELASLMAELGCFTAVNLDGGGSTNMMASTVWNGKMHSVNSPTENRKVINAVGLTYKNENADTSPYGILLENEKNAVFIGEQVKIQSALYTKDNRPIDGEITWSATKGTVENGIFTAKEGGLAKITAKSGSAKASTEIFVVDEISGIDAESKIKLSPGESKAISLNVFDNDGHFVSVKNISPFTFTSSNPDVVSVKNGIVTAHKNGSAVIMISKGKVISYISVASGTVSENISYTSEDLKSSFLSYPDYVGGNVLLNKENPISDAPALALSYDFTYESEDSKAAYAVLDNPLTLPEGVKSLSISFGSDKEFSHEIRALIKDAEGKDLRVSFNKSDKNSIYTAKIPEAASPLSLTRFYALYQEGEAKDSGTIYISDLSATYIASALYPQKPHNVYSDSLEGVTEGKTLRFGAISEDKSSLLSIHADTEMKKTITSSDAGLIVGTDKKFSAKSIDNALIITLDTSKGGIRKTAPSQWDSLKKAINDSNKPNLFIVSGNEIFGTDAFENRVLKSYLSSLKKNVFVIEKGSSDALTIIDGVRYFTLSPLAKDTSVSSKINTLSYLEFYISDSVFYSLKPLYE